MTEPLQVITQANAAPAETNLARILRVNLKAMGPKALQGIPPRINLQDQKTKRIIQLKITADGVSLHRRDQSLKPDVIGDFNPFAGEPPDCVIRSGWRKPLLKSRLLALLTPRLRPWPQAAKDLFDRSHQIKNSEITITIECRESGEQYVWGQGSESVVIIARKQTLTYLFNGLSMLIDDILKGRIQCQASLRSIAHITDATTDQWMDLNL